MCGSRTQKAADIGEASCNLVFKHVVVEVNTCFLLSPKRLQYECLLQPFCIGSCVRAPHERHRAWHDDDSETAGVMLGIGTRHSVEAMQAVHTLPMTSPQRVVVNLCSC